MAATKSPITRRRALAGTAGLAGSLAINVGQAKDNEQPQSMYNPLDKYPALPSNASRSRGPVSLREWIHRRIMEKEPIVVLAGSQAARRS
jgi:hypothetical protein